MTEQRQQEVRTFGDCVSELERKQRLGVYVVSVILMLVWLLLCVGTMGAVLGLTLLAWVVNLVTAEYHVRKIQAMGATVSERQFPAIHAAAGEVCRRFGVKEDFKIIVLQQASVNAFAVRFARKHVVVLFSELVEGIMDQPAQLRALLAHEICHTVLDHGKRRFVEWYKPAKFKQGRELTCDNAGCVAAGSVRETRTMLKKLCVGNRLYAILSEQELVDEARQIQAGFVGWFVRGKLTHPPIGARLENVVEFGRRAGVPEMSEGEVREVRVPPGIGLSGGGVKV